MQIAVAPHRTVSREMSNTFHPRDRYGFPTMSSIVRNNPTAQNHASRDGDPRQPFLAWSIPRRPGVWRTSSVSQAVLGDRHLPAISGGVVSIPVGLHERSTLDALFHCGSLSPYAQPPAFDVRCHFDDRCALKWPESGWPPRLGGSDGAILRRSIRERPPRTVRERQV